MGSPAEEFGKCYFPASCVLRVSLGLCYWGLWACPWGWCALALGHWHLGLLKENLNTGRSRFNSWTQSYPLFILLRNKTNWSLFLDCKLSGAGISAFLCTCLYSEKQIWAFCSLACQCSEKNLIDSNGNKDKAIQQEENLRRAVDIFPMTSLKT